MILNTGSRTDIPAYYSEWFYNRIEAGYVLSRNPYYPSQVTRYLLSPELIDVMIFCSKNPEPMFERISLLAPYSTFWFVTITPYGKDIEPYVPPKEQVIRSFQRLSRIVGRQRISWRYDPVFITEEYSVSYHIGQFGEYAVSRARNRKYSWKHFPKRQRRIICRYICAVRMRLLSGRMWMRTDVCHRLCWRERLAAD